MARQSKIWKYHDETIKGTQYHIKWGYNWYGKPYIKKQGYGTNYSQLSKEEYFNELANKRENGQK